MRRFLLAAGLALSVQGAAHAAVESECEDRLVRTLEVLDQTSPLKGELATGIMWLRMDAEEALAEGDTATCLKNVAIVEDLLGLS
jgi:hypothetical protein